MKKTIGLLISVIIVLLIFLWVLYTNPELLHHKDMENSIVSEEVLELKQQIEILKTEKRITSFEKKLENLIQENEALKTKCNALEMQQHQDSIEGNSEKNDQKQENNETKKESFNVYFSQEITWYNTDLSTYLVPVSFEFTWEKNTSEKIEYALKKLFSIKDKQYGMEKFNNFLAYSDVVLQEIENKDGQFIIKINGTLMWVWGMADPLIKLQITKTIEQFTNSYNIILNGSSTGWKCIFDMKWWCEEQYKNNISTRYRKIYSTKYSLYKKNNEVYTICLAGNNDVCIDITQYHWDFQQYWTSKLWLSNNLDSSVFSTVAWRKIWKCTTIYDSEFCFNENKNGTLIMNIWNSWIGFHNGLYDPKEILKVIDF